MSMKSGVMTSIYQFAEKSMAVSKFLFVNIMDPNIKGTRYRIK